MNFFHSTISSTPVFMRLLGYFCLPFLIVGFSVFLTLFSPLHIFAHNVGGLSFQNDSLTTNTDTSLTQQRIGWRVLPIPSYAPETSFALTVAGVHYFAQPDGNSESRLNQLFFGVQYTLRNQFIASVLPEMYFNRENIRLFGQFEVSRYPDFFYGVGNALPESNREPFTIFRAAAIGSLWFSLNGQGIRNGVNAGVRFDIDYQNVIERTPNGILAANMGDTVAGRHGGLLSGVGLAINYDTRDVVVAPRTGGYVDFRLVPYTRLLGSNFEAWRMTLDVHKYWTFAPASLEDNGFAHTLALQWFNDFTWGDVPFFRMGMIGQNISGLALGRGYFGGRFRDKILSHVQAEYRFPIFWRFGGVVFAGAGNVSPSLETFELSSTKTSIGAGLRFAVVPEERINLRIDVGYGFATQTIYPYVSFTEAF